eukprot:694778-Prymnesium_polylepis.2
MAREEAQGERGVAAETKELGEGRLAWPSGARGERQGRRSAREEEMAREEAQGERGVAPGVRLDFFRELFFRARARPSADRSYRRRACGGAAAAEFLAGGGQPRAAARLAGDRPRHQAAVAQADAHSMGGGAGAAAERGIESAPPRQPTAGRDAARLDRED